MEINAETALGRHFALRDDGEAPVFHRPFGVGDSANNIDAKIKRTFHVRDRAL